MSQPIATWVHHFRRWKQVLATAICPKFSNIFSAFVVCNNVWIPIKISLFGYEIKENVCQMQLCYESKETIEFSVPVEYAKCQMLRWLEII